MPVQQTFAGIPINIQYSSLQNNKKVLKIVVKQIKKFLIINCHLRRTWHNIYSDILYNIFNCISRVK